MIAIDSFSLLGTIRLLVLFLMTHILVSANSFAASADGNSTVVPLIKQQYPGNPPNIDLLHINIVALGKNKLNVPLMFDTGSAGVTIDCLVVLPRKLCSSAGIKIERELQLKDLVVTTTQIVSSYGIYDEYGNLAYAKVSFGSSKNPVETRDVLPILIRYKKVRRATGEIVGGRLWPLGMFGVSPIGGGAQGALPSPLDFVDVEQGLHRGFYLSPVGPKWKACANEDRNCPTVDALHIGLDDATIKEFKLSKIHRDHPNQNFATINTCLNWKETYSCGPTLFDTGQSTISVLIKKTNSAMSALDRGTMVRVTGENFGIWDFKTRYRPEVEFGSFSPWSDVNVIGMRYFEENSILFNLESQEIGFRIGR